MAISTLKKLLFTNDELKLLSFQRRQSVLNLNDDLKGSSSERSDIELNYDRIKKNASKKAIFASFFSHQTLN